MNGAELFTKSLENEDVKFIFGLPGEENIDLLEAISKSDINFVVTRHEQGAAFMADAVGRVTRKPGVCISTLGPGATNLVTGVANANLDRVPLVAITAQASRNRLHKESHQNVDTLALFSGITKYNRAVIVKESIPEIVRKAFSTAGKNPYGASHIQFPEDIAKEKITDFYIMEKPGDAVYEANGKLIEKAAALINSSQSPLILAGNGVIREEVWESVKRFVDISGIPLVSTFMAKGILPYDHPLNLFVVGAKPFPEKSMRPLLSADLVIAIGFDMVEYDPVTWNDDRKRKIININTSMAETDEHFPVAFDLVGNIDITLAIMGEKIAKRSLSPIHREVREKRKQYFESEGKGKEILPKKIMKFMGEISGPNSLVVSDVGLHKLWVSRYYQPASPDRTIIYNGFASMGASLPAAIGINMVKPDLDITVFSGDGGFLMNVQELETARRTGADFKVVVFNDCTYSLIESKQEDAGYKPEYVRFTNPDFSLLAKSFGAQHFLSEDLDSFKKSYKEAEKIEGVKIIEVQVNR
ncbi:acetolactate synthase large subunit [Caldiplasma sukawensis]